MITRRDAVISSAGLVGASLLPAAPAFSAAPDAVVGLQESFVFAQWRAAMKDVICAGPGNASDLRLWKTLSRRDDADDVFFRSADDPGVLRVVSLAAPGVSRLPAALAADFAVMANDALARTLSDRSARMVGLATVSMRHPQAAAREAERAVSKLGFRGVVLQPHESGQMIDAPQFERLFETIADLKVPVFFQSAHPPAAQPQGDAAMSGASADAALPLIRMIFGGTFDRWPGLQVIAGLGDGGLYWSHKMSSIHRNLRAAGDRLPRRHPRDYLADNVLTTTAGMRSLATVRTAHEIFGARSVLLSMTGDHDRARWVDWLGAAGLTQAERRSLGRDAALVAFYGAASV